MSGQVKKDVYGCLRGKKHPNKNELSLLNFWSNKKSSFCLKYKLCFYFSFILYWLISGSANIESSILLNVYSLSTVSSGAFDFKNSPVSFSIITSLFFSVNDVEDKNPFIV